jgi:hypothetical protein
MNIKSKIAGIFMVALLCLASACSKKASPVQPVSADPLNRVSKTPPSLLHFLHKTFRVGEYTKYDFEVPAHATAPKLQGNFKSFLPGTKPESASEAANVDFMLMNADEFDAFVHSRGAMVRYSISAAHDQTIDYALPPTFENPVKYYVVFRNSSDPKQARMVAADFSVSF